MRNLHKSKDYVKTPISDTAHITPQNHGSMLEGRCKCGKPSAMVWIRQLGFSLENKYWCNRCFEKEKEKEERKNRNGIKH